jgi:hypothetical protein
MALAHSGLNSFKQYLRNDFGWKRPWYCEVTKEVFQAEDIARGLYLLQQEEPDMYKLLGYVWLSYNRRNDIADARYIDPSTLKRTWDRAMHWIKVAITYPGLLPNNPPRRKSRGLA